MSQHPSSPAGATSGRSGFDERLSVPWWWYGVALGLAVLVGAEIHMGYPGVRAWIGYVVCVPLCVLPLVVLGRTRVRVADDRLHVGPSSVALARLGRAEVVPPERRRLALGPELDPAAHLMLRPWIKSVVRVEVTDPEDPAPYWVFSVRNAQGLLTALGR